MLLLLNLPLHIKQFVLVSEQLLHFLMQPNQFACIYIFEIFDKSKKKNVFHKEVFAYFIGKNKQIIFDILTLTSLIQRIS